MNAKRLAIVLAICLVVSLSFNLFFAGALVAKRWFERPFGAAVNSLMQTLPPSLRDDVRRRLAEDRADLREAIADLREARRRMFDAMRAEPFDREALDRTMQDVRENTGEVQALLQSALAATLQSAPAAERQKIKAPRRDFGLFRKRLEE